ncbi:TPA: hypothetical protein PIQ33_002749 [Klebsiella oxytoca]|nr:hypothetical protein [Klebsiella oxytoca]
MASPLSVAATGMCCNVGYSVPSAFAAIQAGLDHFTKTSFYDLNGQPLVGAQLYQNDTWGEERLLWMSDCVIAECISKQPEMILAKTCLIFILPETEKNNSHKKYALLFEQKKSLYHPSSFYIQEGKAGIGTAILNAQHLIYSELISHVLIVGVDSYFSPARINDLLSHERVLCTSNRDGFIPGEGAGAIVLCKPQSDEFSICITGTGVDNEVAHINQFEKPNLAKGLSSAIRKALQSSGHLLIETDFHASGVTGESWYFRETTLAINRCLEKKKTHYRHYQLASNLGETGAASGPLTLAYLNEVLLHLPEINRKALLHFSGDNGQRIAFIAEYLKG